MDGPGHVHMGGRVQEEGWETVQKTLMACRPSRTQDLVDSLVPIYNGARVLADGRGLSSKADEAPLGPPR